MSNPTSNQTYPPPPPPGYYGNAQMQNPPTPAYYGNAQIQPPPPTGYYGNTQMQPLPPANYIQMQEPYPQGYYGGRQSVNPEVVPENPWSNVPIQQSVQNDGESLRHAGQNEDDEPELRRASNGHVLNSFWTDNTDRPAGPGERRLANFGCSCFIGPICSDVRKNDFKRLLMSITFWIAVIDLIFLFIEWGMGGISFPSLGPLGYRGEKALLNLGAKYLPLIYCKKQVFRYITPVLLHAGLWHYALNTYFAFNIMLSREVYWGRIRTIAVYVAGGIGASVFSLAIYPWHYSVGASGALCAIYGGYIVDVLRMWKKMDNQMRFVYGLNIVTFFVMNLIFGFIIPHVDNGAHLGGLLTGIGVGMVLLLKNISLRVFGGAGIVFLCVIITVVTYVKLSLNCSYY